MIRYPLSPLAQAMGMSLNAACEALGVSGFPKNSQGACAHMGFTHHHAQHWST